MHTLLYVMIEEDKLSQLDQILEERMAPFNEELSDDGRWNWYQIGGRWTGHFSDYDPEKDPANIETCRLCEGTGRRCDEIGEKARKVDPTYTCNGCNGEGRSVKWPTEWQSSIEVNTITISEFQTRNLGSPYALLDIQGKWHEREAIHSHPDFPGWPHKGKVTKPDYEAFEKKLADEWKREIELNISTWPGSTHLVVVDYHS